MSHEHNGIPCNEDHHHHIQAVQGHIGHVGCEPGCQLHLHFEEPAVAAMRQAVERAKEDDDDDGTAESKFFKYQIKTKRRVGRLAVGQ